MGLAWIGMVISVLITIGIIVLIVKGILIVSWGIVGFFVTFLLVLLALEIIETTGFLTAFCLVIVAFILYLFFQ